MAIKVNRILYADDDPDDHFIFSKIINEHFPDIQLIQHYSCAQVMPYINDSNTILPDVIFLDLNMLGNEKFQCLDSIKKFVKTEDIPVVIYSTGSPELALHALALGAFKFISKPFSYDDIAMEIKKVISELQRR